MDYMYPSIFFAYFLFALLTALALYFFLRSRRQGYWGRDSEEPARRMILDDDEGGERHER